MKYCANCGAQVENEAVICPYCGSKQTEGVAQASASQTQTKFCTNCGAEIHAEAVVCPKCGCKQTTETDSDNNSTMGTIALVFMIIACVTAASLVLPLAWCIPMTIMVNNRLKANRPISLALKICTLIFVSVVSGILLLCMKDPDKV